MAERGLVREVMGAREWRARMRKAAPWQSTPESSAAMGNAGGSYHGPGKIHRREAEISRSCYAGMLARFVASGMRRAA